MQQHLRKNQETLIIYLITLKQSQRGSDTSGIQTFSELHVPLNLQTFSALFCNV